MKFSVLNRWTGSIQFTADIKCADDELESVKLGLAVKWAFKTGASLDGASLVGARLDGASLDGASLVGARLDGASLVGASLVGARLDGASLVGALLGPYKIKDAITLAYPNGWHAFTYLTDKGEQRIRVGCRDKTIAEGREYWADKKDRREVMAVLDYAEALAKIRGWIK